MINCDQENINMTEIVGGLSVKDLMDGGTTFEVKYEEHEKDPSKELEYYKEAALHTKMECLDFGNPYDGKDPFDNLAQKMTNLLPNGKIKKRVLREGYGEKPDPSSSVKIHYNGYVQYEALPFDSTYGRKKPFSFEIGEGQVLEGLDLAVQSMKINEKSQFLVDSELAYRSSGLNRIPPNSTILFEIELFGILLKTTEKELQEENSFPQIYKFCLGQCVKGKRMFRLGDYSGAIKEYNIAVEKLEYFQLNNYEEQQQSEELLTRLYTNLLICHTQVQNPRKGCIYAQRLYEMVRSDTNKISAKVHFNHAKCLRMLGDFQRANKRLNKAKKLEPRNPEILQEFLAIRKAEEEYNKRMSAMGKALVNN